MKQESLILLSFILCMVPLKYCTGAIALPHSCSVSGPSPADRQSVQLFTVNNSNNPKGAYWEIFFSTPTATVSSMTDSQQGGLSDADRVNLLANIHSAFSSISTQTSTVLGGTVTGDIIGSPWESTTRVPVVNISTTYPLQVPSTSGPNNSGLRATYTGSNGTGFNVRFTASYNSWLTYGRATSLADMKTVGIVNLPVANEYITRTLILNVNMNYNLGPGNYSGYTNVTTSGPFNALTALPLPYSYSITCTREATPLTLTLDATEVDFGTVYSGQGPLTKPLGWRATGNGQAGIWTLRFDSPQATGDQIVLGDARVSILDAQGNRVPLSSDVAIAGAAGEYLFQLTAGTTMTGAQTARVTLTLTAN